MEYYKKTIKLVKLMLIFVVSCVIFAYFVRPYMNQLMANKNAMMFLMQSGQTQTEEQPQMEDEEPDMQMQQQRFQEQQRMQMEQQRMQSQPEMQAQQQGIQMQEQFQMENEEDVQMEEQDDTSYGPDEDEFVKMSLQRLRQVHPGITPEEEKTAAEGIRAAYKKRMQEN